MNTKHTSNWLIDAALFLGLIAAFFLDLTGLALHQWIGVGIGAIALYHLVVHWQWVSAVTGRFFGKTTPRSRSYYLINLSILAGFFIITFTGLVISSWLHLSLSNPESWLRIHILASIGTLILVTFKIVLHWRWIAAVTRKIFSPSPAPAARPAPVRPVPSGNGQLSRAEFIKVLGVASLASLFALSQAANSLPSLETASASTAQASLGTNPSAATTNLASASQDCTVRCDRGCSFPGHCHRYTDTDGNGRCDYGECA